MSLPSFLKKYFWEVDFKILDTKKHRTYIIERILEYGDTDAVRWLLTAYPAKIIIGVLKNSRSLSKKSAHFWALFFGVPESKILCFLKPFQMHSKAIWNR